MHEASLINDLIRRIEQLANEQKGSRISAVHIWLGALSHMSKSHFVDHFELAANGGVAGNAVLNIMVSTEINHPNAQHIILESVEFEHESP
jgi:hydrogenase nickel incorporation protein HypA/HybF